MPHKVGREIIRIFMWYCPSCASLRINVKVCRIPWRHFMPQLWSEFRRILLPYFFLHFTLWPQKSICGLSLYWNDDVFKNGAGFDQYSIEKRYVVEEGWTFFFLKRWQKLILLYLCSHGSACMGSARQSKVTPERGERHIPLRLIPPCYWN